jgi:hypothetical protein
MVGGESHRRDAEAASRGAPRGGGGEERCQGEKAGAGPGGETFVRLLRSGEELQRSCAPGQGPGIGRPSATAQPQAQRQTQRQTHDETRRDERESTTVPYQVTPRQAPPAPGLR